MTKNKNFARDSSNINALSPALAVCDQSEILEPANVVKIDWR